jgi:hypothetical protein
MFLQDVIRLYACTNQIDKLCNMWSATYRTKGHYIKKNLAICNNLQIDTGDNQPATSDYWSHGNILTNDRWRWCPTVGSVTHWCMAIPNTLLLARLNIRQNTDSPGTWMHCSAGSTPSVCQYIAYKYLSMSNL